MKTYTEKELANMKKADLIALLQSQGQEVLQAMQDAQDAQKKADLQAQKAQKTLQDITGFSAERLQYEENKYNEAVKCFYQFPAVFAQDTVEYRAQHDAFLQELGRKYIQEVLQNEGRQAGKTAGRKTKPAGRKAAGTGNTAGRKAQKKEDNNLYKYLCTKVDDLQETDKYSTIKKDGKTVARVYVMRDNKLKFLVKEDTAKKATGLAFTTMKFNLPCAIIAQTEQDVDKLVNAF